MRELLLMYKISENNKIIDSHYSTISNHFTLENKNTTQATSCINLSSSGARILIVDDDPDITFSFSIGLEDGGFEVYTYNDPLDTLLNFKPSINMPKMNGLSFVPKY